MHNILPQKEPLHPLSAGERKTLEQLSRSLTMPADQVIHAKEVLAVADGHSFTEAARTKMKWPETLIDQIVTERQIRQANEYSPEPSYREL